MMASSPLTGPIPSLAPMAPLRVARCGTPRTPEPMARDGGSHSRAPSPPRPRFKLKRRAVSAQNPLSAPTQHFLASVAAADIPIPSIEEPEIAADHDVDMACAFVDISRHSLMSHENDDDMDHDLSLNLRGRQFSIPKTPAPCIAPSLSPNRYPNWSTGSAFSSSTDGESSPEPDFSSLSRPSTSRSTYTNASLFSRLSHFSDFSPEPESVKQSMQDVESQDATSAHARGRSRRAPWTKPMSSHLWATYMMYLQDPRVTPFRTGKGCIPPHGVCLRVAREAKKSWKGSKASKRTDPTDSLKSGSSTPVANATGTFIEWPHTCAATRKHLRELCKLRAAAPGGGLGLRYMSRSPTPFVHAATRHWNHRSTPVQPTGSAFATNDIAMSLALSTADSMQPNGPLAKLAGSDVATPQPAAAKPIAMKTPQKPMVTPDHAPPPPNNRTQWAPRQPSFSFDQPRRLGSPFVVPNSYGPSSTTSLAAVLGLSAGSAYTTRQAPSSAVGQRRATLQSPARLSSRAGMHKRRSTALAGGRASQHEMRRKRPSLGSDFWTDPTKGNMSSSSAGDHVPSDAEMTAATFGQAPPSASSSMDFSIPRTTGSLGSSLADRSHQPQRQAPPSLPTTPPSRAQLAPPANPPPRLGSPFSMTSTSFSFPNRMFQPTSEARNDADVFLSGPRNRSYSTVHTYQPPMAQPTFFSSGQGAVVAGRVRARAPSAAAIEGRAPGRDNLARRLAYIDDRLKELRSRDLNQRGSESPF
ncbi:hypothetical protein GGTG_04009 [Gaeumannomyces tritici R3-111a-1]|uniref:Uncharacterized protein n=1 Tax=Gaeumannomyces tritici (strain R3-111a-1) TaxID=644352 RepID=J3NRW1_GAET3|nr:hypothetical protein GGTG_04009 [Gaeumannomyces tritici R3-111a-1]EJT78917.1 hypothetical protein GGTG_04009 [Gaeumannomyces tritici R3-111a-1]